MPIFKRKHKKETEVPVSNSDVRLVDLNIGQLNTNDFTIRKSVVFDFLLLTYSPSGGADVGKVLLKDTVFWQKGNSSDVAQFVRCYFRQGVIRFVELVINSNGSAQYLYFYKDYFRWVSTTSHRYAQVFSRQVSNYFVFKSVKLRLSGNVNELFFYVHKMEKAPFHIITPKPAFKVEKVVDGVLTVWDSNKSDSCVNALVFHKNKRPVLVHLQISSPEGLESIYLRKEPLTWNRITRSEFTETIRNSGFNPDLFSSFLTLKLDLSNVTENFNVDNHSYSYSPNNFLPTSDNTPDNAPDTVEVGEHLSDGVKDTVTSKHMVRRVSNVDMSTRVECISISPKPGYTVVEILDDDFSLFNVNTHNTSRKNSGGHNNSFENGPAKKFVVFVNLIRYKDYKLLGIYFRGNKGTDVQFFTKPFKGKWTPITPEQYYSLYVPDNLSNSLGNPGSPSAKMSKSLNPVSLVMGSFVNRLGLKIQTYSSPVINGKGNIILVHGAYGHFCSDFTTYNRDYLLKYEQFKSLPEVKSVDEVVSPTFDLERQLYDAISHHSDVFEYRTLDELELSQTGERFLLKNSFVEALNNLGYGVYGLDLTSHGRSEPLNNLRYYVNSFMDYVHDVLQFIDIVKLKTKSSQQPNGSKLYLLGYSMGSNIALRAINHYYQDLKLNPNNNPDGDNEVDAKLVDGMVSISGMYDFAAMQNSFLRSLATLVISILSFLVPENPNPFEKFFDYTISLDAYTRYRDPWVWPKKSRNKMLYVIARAVSDLPKYLSYIPEDMRVLMINSNKDDLVTLKVLTN
ncbi:phospholipase, putative [Theileria annulata]|uniref:Phospholipase, putative n=1 Tax=Theileria annulata TaxID=5874 RepID=Q4UCN1_THEAN|nr:phospholipase, putative [Theileria annulata]CAI75420.1 phospholipase, putative [Theileria annulata]|eukprot:XP_954896.1 phospholipase, putative [Theileria annulata]